MLVPHAPDLTRSPIDPEVAHRTPVGGRERALPDFSPIAVDGAPARPRVEAHLEASGWITGRTIRTMVDLDIQQATQMRDDLRSADVVRKDPDGPQRGRPTGCRLAQPRATSASTSSTSARNRSGSCRCG